MVGKINMQTGSPLSSAGTASAAMPAIARGDSATSVLADPANPAVSLSPVAFSAERKEGRWADAGAVRTLYADIRNPHAALALANFPVRIAVGFGQGEVRDPDQLRLRDAAGSIVPWQWEGGEHPLTGVSLELWPDGSLRCGDMWFNLTAAAGAKARYLIEKHPVPLGQVFAQNVVFSSPTPGSIDQLQTAGMTARFENGQAWGLRRYQDRANGDLDIYQGTAGCYTKIQTLGGVAKLSSNGADVTQVSHGVVGASSFGNGVVFQRYETNFNFTDATAIQNRVRYRMFADGSIRGEDRKTYPADIATHSHWNVVQAAVRNDLTPAHTTDQSHFYNTHSYTNGATLSNFMFGGYCLSKESAADDGKTVQYIPMAVQETVTSDRFGVSGSSAINAGLVQRNAFFLCKYATGDVVNEHARRFNRIAAIGAQPRPETDLAGLRRLTVDWAKSVQPKLTVNGWGGVSALVALFLSPADPAAALTEYQAFCTGRGINPSNSSNYLAQWTSGSQGFEYQGRNTQVLWWLREAFRKAGDTTRQTLVESYVHAFADMCVAAESASGGGTPNGQVWLSGASQFYAWNGGTTCLAAIGASLAITANATRQASFTRIAAAFAAGNFAGPIWSYSSATTPVETPTTAYEGYQKFELGRAFKLQPAMSLPSGDLCNYLAQTYVGEGISNEWFSNLRYRQGAMSTQWYTASCCALLNGDYSAAYELCRHVQQATNGVVNADTAQIDGWTRPPGTDGFNGFDVRVLIEMLNWTAT